MIPKQLLGLITCAALLALSGCSSPTVTPSMTPSSVSDIFAPTAYVTPDPTNNMATVRADANATVSANQTARALTPTRTPDPSRTPTLAPSPTPTLAPTVAVPLNPAGPWLVFLAAAEENGPRYLWAINADGTGLTKLLEDPVLTFRAQPIDSLENGVIIAYVPFVEWGQTEFTLRLLTFPSGVDTVLTSLYDAASMADVLNGYDVGAALEMGGLAWSPDGRTLAFVSAIDGASLDVYTYSLDTRTFTRLSSGPTQAYDLSWSPDGTYVVHRGFTFIGMGGPADSGMWAARADGQIVTPLAVPTSEEDPFIDIVMTLGWRSPTEVLVSQAYYEGVDTIRLVNVETGEAQTIIEAEFVYAVYAQEHDTWLLVPNYAPGPEDHLILVRGEERTEIPGNMIGSVGWFSEYDVFLGQAQDGKVYTISPDGEVSLLPINSEWTYGPLHSIYVSPDETLWAWHIYGFYESVSELWVGQPMVEPNLIDATSYGSFVERTWIQDLTWSPDSQRLVFLRGRGLWTAERPDFVPVPIVPELFANDWNSWEGVWLP